MGNALHLVGAWGLGLAVLVAASLVVTLVLIFLCSPDMRDAREGVMALFLIAALIFGAVAVPVTIGQYVIERAIPHPTEPS